MNFYLTDPSDKMSLSVSLRYLDNLSDSFFKNIPRLKIYKMLCLLLKLIISIILKHAIQSITLTFNRRILFIDNFNCSVSVTHFRSNCVLIDDVDQFVPNRVIQTIQIWTVSRSVIFVNQ